MLTTQKKISPQNEERNTLLQGLQETKQELDVVYMGFNQATDADLIDYYLFEVDALRARYNYLLRRIKALDSPSETLAPTTSSIPQTPPG